MAYQFMTAQKAKVVALAYLKDGNKGDAMLAAGFPPEYIHTSKSYTMFRGEKVQKAIEELEEESAKLTGDLTLETVIAGFRAMAFPGKDVNVSNADKNYALDKLAKIKGGYVDKLLIGRGTDEEPTPVSAEQVEFYQLMARAATKDRLSRPGSLPGEVGQADLDNLKPLMLADVKALGIEGDEASMIESIFNEAATSGRSKALVHEMIKVNFHDKQARIDNPPRAFGEPAVNLHDPAYNPFAVEPEPRV